jgi:hypothetical protein
MKCEPRPDLTSVVPTEVEESLKFRLLSGPSRKNREMSRSEPDWHLARHDNYESQAEKFARSSGKQLRFLFGGKVRRFDELARFCFA